MDPTAKNTLLEKLRIEMAWQWRWEKKYRHFYYGTTCLSWLSSFLILVLAFYQLQLGQEYQRWVILSITALSTLAVSLPVLSMTLKFQQHQEVYDGLARAYDLLETKLRTGAISTEEALAEFERLHSQPTEKVIRETA